MTLCGTERRYIKENVDTFLPNRSRVVQWTSVLKFSVLPTSSFVLFLERKVRQEACPKLCFHSLASRIVHQFTVFNICELPTHTQSLFYRLVGRMYGFFIATVVLITNFQRNSRLCFSVSFDYL